MSDLQSPVLLWWLVGLGFVVAELVATALLVHLSSRGSSR
jgi:hypothetical protein